MLATCLAALLACRSPDTQGSSASTSQRSSAFSEKRKENVRKLRASLPGKQMKDVVRILGKPSQVSTLEERETWDYKNAAYDPVTGLPVRSLQVLFVNRRVDSINFSY